MAFRLKRMKLTMNKIPQGEDEIIIRYREMSKHIEMIAALTWEERGFFRCSKSMVINIYRISTLRSESGKRILAQMETGEQVMISRRYARELRRILKGGAEGLFFLFMLFSFVCVCLVNKIRRAYDTRNLNRMLTEFKKGELN